MRRVFFFGHGRITGSLRITFRFCMSNFKNIGSIWTKFDYWLSMFIPTSSSTSRMQVSLSVSFFSWWPPGNATSPLQGSPLREARFMYSKCRSSLKWRMRFHSTNTNYGKKFEICITYLQFRFDIILVREKKLHSIFCARGIFEIQGAAKKSINLVPLTL